MAEVISLDLSSEEEVRDVTPRKKKVFRCLNPECRTPKNLVKAQEKIRRYYGVTAFKKKTRICLPCIEKAQVHKNSLISYIREGCNIMDKKITLHKNTMVLTDSESEKSDMEEWEDNSELEYDLEELNKNPMGSHDKNSLNELKDVITEVMSDLKLTNQITDGKKNINRRLVNADREFKNLDEEYKNIEHEIDDLRKQFYETFTTEIKWLPSLEICPQDANNETSEITEVISDLPQLVSVQLPPVGPLVRPKLKMKEKVYSMKQSSFSPWMPAVVIGIEREEATETIYLIQYNKFKEHFNSVLCQKQISGKKLAYFDECSTRVEVGSRIIAKFYEEDKAVQENGCWYVGIVSEIPNAANNYRYLIFFDDGYAQYVYHRDLRVVTQSSVPCWEDVATESKEFIKDYLQTYPERPMVRLAQYNLIKTELNGKWWNAQVLQVDGSLAKMLFPSESRTEWIYRGSTRLSPLFDKKLKIQIQTEQMKSSKNFIRRRTAPSHRSGPVVEYVNFNEDQGDDNNDGLKEALKPIEKRAVARKSTAKASTVMSVALVHIKENLVLEAKGEYQYKPIKGSSVQFRPHQCNSKCLGNEQAVNDTTISTLFKPILMGWRRQVVKQKKKTLIRTLVNYVSPCGRRLRSLDEIFRFLRLSKSKLEIDFFTFDIQIILERVWWPSRQLYHIPDITDGKEDMFISCVNSIDSNKPKTLVYSNIRLPSKNVGINMDPNFLVCCSCEDDCQDKSRCECWQLTTESARRNRTPSSDIGYKHRRLHEQVITGIYECNSQCSCKKSCLNRIVQFPIRQKLQLFKTARRGWGVRTLNDLPLGTFICVYVGRVLTEAEANEEGMTDGADDYYAELDFIEVTESTKEGYESDVTDIEADESEPYDQISSKKTKTTDFVFRGRSDNPTHGREKSSRLLARQQSKATDSEEESEDSDEDTGRQRQTFEPKNANKDPQKMQEPHKTLRELFGSEEDVFIMDAKVTGNIGRYLNHSCNPNVFVQNVFVDTHDPRFPSIAFFAGTNIKAGSELTWDYSYEVDSVPGKIKYCYCQSPNCRGRLL